MIDSGIPVLGQNRRWGIRALSGSSSIDSRRTLLSCSIGHRYYLKAKALHGPCQLAKATIALRNTRFLNWRLCRKSSPALTNDESSGSTKATLRPPSGHLVASR
jgi:hypothetical protein